MWHKYKVWIGVILLIILLFVAYVIFRSNVEFIELPASTPKSNPADNLVLTQRNKLDSMLPVSTENFSVELDKVTLLPTVKYSTDFETVLPQVQNWLTEQELGLIPLTQFLFVKNV